MQIGKREKIGLYIFAFIILTFVSLYFFKINNSKATINQEKIVDKKDNGEIQVYITGRIKTPGVYRLKEGDRLKTLIEMAGGLLEGADISRVNMALKLRDEEHINIPDINDVNLGNSTTSDGKININLASKEELKTLPRIGDSYAERIIEYREKNGPFNRIEDIKKVSGIGDKIFESLKDKISVR